MKAFALALAMTIAQQPASLPALPACDALDVNCLKLHLADQVLQIRDLSQQLDSKTQQLDIAKASEAAALSAAKSANEYAQKIQLESRGHWYESPALFFALGFLVASAASIGLAAAFAHVSR